MYLGQEPSPSTTQSRHMYTAQAAQTVFNTSGYEPGFVDLFMNGVKLQEGVDWNGNDGLTCVLTTGAALNDIIEITIFKAKDNAETVGGGLFRGNRGAYGSAAAANDIFRIHAQTLTQNTTIISTENAICVGPLSIDTNVVLQVDGNLTVV